MQEDDQLHRKTGNTGRGKANFYSDASIRSVHRTLPSVTRTFLLRRDGANNGARIMTFHAGDRIVKVPLRISKRIFAENQQRRSQRLINIRCYRSCAARTREGVVFNIFYSIHFRSEFFERVGIARSITICVSSMKYPALNIKQISRIKSQNSKLQSKTFDHSILRRRCCSLIKSSSSIEIPAGSGLKLFVILMAHGT